MSKTRSERDLVLEAGKLCVKSFLLKLHTRHRFSKEEIVYDVVASSDNSAVFLLHETIKFFIEQEIKNAETKDAYKISFKRIPAEEYLWAMEISSKGFECYVLAGILANVVAKLDVAREEKRSNLSEAVETIIREIRKDLSLTGKISTKVRDTGSIYKVVIRFKGYNWKPLEFQNPRYRELIDEVNTNLRKKVQKMLSEKKKVE